MSDDNPDPLCPTQDSRGFFMLPRSPAEAGWYTYGRFNGAPDLGAYQYPHPVMMQAILRVGLEWQAIDKRRFGVGNISLAGGPKNKDHKGHRTGLQVDMRALRKDGREAPVTWTDLQYDREGTAKLIDLFRTFAPVTLVLFNDTSIPFVKPAEHHDDHFHLELMG
jgi:hypothetical protein